jgi:hypothetical protein
MDRPAFLRVLKRMGSQRDSTALHFSSWLNDICQTYQFEILT